MERLQIEFYQVVEFVKQYKYTSLIIISAFIFAFIGTVEAIHSFTSLKRVTTLSFR